MLISILAMLMLPATAHSMSKPDLAMLPDDFWHQLPTIAWVVVKVGWLKVLIDMICQSWWYVVANDFTFVSVLVAAEIYPYYGMGACYSVVVGLQILRTIFTWVLHAVLFRPQHCHNSLQHDPNVLAGDQE
jgi:hypothetical protein